MTDGRQFNLPDAGVVTDAAGFAAVCDHLSSVDRFAFDAEFIGEDAYVAEVCLIQVATDDGIWLIDPLAGFEIRRFWDLVTDDGVEKVVHAGLEDLALSYQHTGDTPNNVFDIQIAAGLVGVNYPLSLQRLARFALGVRLHKSQTLTDWRKRPLSKRQIQYAIDDVGYMLAIHASLRKRLARRGRAEWAKEECARFCAQETYRQDPKDAVSRVRGAGALGPKALAVARQLTIEREKQARRHNRPPRALLKDHLLIEIAKHGWTSAEELMSLRGMTLRGEALSGMIEAVKRGLATPPEKRPKQSTPQDDSPQEIALCKLLSAVLFDYCRANQIAHQLAATNKDIRAVVLAHTRGENAVAPRALQRGWRQAEFGEIVDGILSGRKSIRVENGESGYQLKLE